MSCLEEIKHNETYHDEMMKWTSPDLLKEDLSKIWENVLI